MDQSRAERCLSVDSFSSNAMGLKSCLCQALSPSHLTSDGIRGFLDKALESRNPRLNCHF